MTLTASARRPRFTDLFVERPVFAVVISAALVIFGIRVALDLPVLQYPQIESASLEIRTPYVGASAETVQGFVTDPIERVAATVPGIDYVESNTTAGLSLVTVYLKLNEDSTAALAELSTRLGQIRFELPAGAEDPAVMVRRADRPAAGWYLGVDIPERLSHAEVTDILRRVVVPQLSAVEGVQEVWLGGGRTPAMRIWLDPQRLAAFNVSAQEVADALRRNNVIATVGQADNRAQRVNLLLNTTLTNVDEFRALVIREVDGTLVRIRDVARVELGHEESQALGRFDQNVTIWLGVYPLPGANEIAIADAIYPVIERLNAALPADLTIVIGSDVTSYMRDALKEIFITLAETVLLVGLVVVALMGSFRTALVPLVTIPVSLLGAVTAMALLGFSFNLLTILAIVLSVGLVVDDAIVVVENVARHMREGLTRRQAALASSRQLLAPIVSMTATLAIVYAPIGFLSGLTGVLFKEFAFTLAIAVVLSGVVALTLSPIMSAYVVPAQGRENAMTRWVNRGFDRLRDRYRALLDRLLERNGQVLFVAVFVTFLAIPFFLFSQRELAPTEDQSSINVVYTAPPEAAIEYSEGYLFDVVAAMQTLGGADRMWQMLIGNGGFGGMEFVPAGERERSVHEMLPEAFARLSAVTGLTAFPVLPSALPSAGRFDMEFVVMSTQSPAQMLEVSRDLLDAARASGRFLFVDTDLLIDLPQGRFALDHDRVADLGLDLESVSRQLSALLSGNYVNRFDLDGKAYRVIPMIEPANRSTADALLDLKLRTPAGDLVPLGALATLEDSVGPRVLSKFQQKNAFRIRGGVMPGTTKEAALATMEGLAAERLPAGYSFDYSGESRQLRQEGNTLLGVLGISLLFVFMALAVQFNSLRDPLVVLLGSVPLALASALLFTFLGWTTVNIYTQIGFITLTGLIAKNGILIVEFARQLQEEGRDKYTAIKEAAATRLRPVLMTAGATIMGHFPLVLVTGAGAEARNSIGIVLVAGMAIGTLFTLFVLPSIYALLAARHRPTEALELPPTASAGAAV
ncbi:MAG: efflux RND transporter permease subunit [Pseudomonadota bacterium]